MTYLIDANVFISANRLHYGLDFCPAFWEWLVQQNSKQRVFSIEAVKQELTRGTDDLAQWAKSRGNEFFLPLDEKLKSALPSVSRWASGAGFAPAALNTFFGAADYFLVAYAASHGHVVVTHETPDPAAKKRVKIPDACSAFKVNCISPWTMLRTEKAKFIL